MYILFAVAAAVVALDQYVKFIVHTKMALFQTIPVIHNFFNCNFNITYIENAGISFGMFGQNEHPAKRWILAAMVLAAIVLVFLYWYKYGRKKPVYDIACGLIIGGAVGNLIDRIMTGRVVDFIEVGYKNSVFPVFNLADSAVSVGVAIFIIFLIFSKEEKKENLNAPDTF
jgi:signal peptidase II